MLYINLGKMSFPDSQAIVCFIQKFEIAYMSDNGLDAGCNW